MPKITFGKARQASSYSVSFPTLPSIKLQPVKITLLEERNHHDTMVMQFSTIRPLWKTLLQTGVPVKLTYSQGSFLREWVGYFLSMSTHTIGQTQEIMEVTCIGSTFVFKDKVSRVFTNTTISNVVKQIVEEHDYKFVGDDTGVFFEQVSLAGHSYWEWITEQAVKLGYGVYIDGMTFYFRRIDNIISAGVTNLPSFIMKGKGAGINVMQDDRTLDWMRATHGDFNPSFSGDKTTKTVHGVDPLDATKHAHTSTPADIGKPLMDTTGDVLFSQVNQEHVAHSLGAAKALSEGYAQNVRFNLFAKLKGQGDPRIRVLNPVMVAGTSDLSDGIWIVTRVAHFFTSNKNYQVELDLMTDGSGLISKEYASKTQNNIAGMVDLNEALKNGGKNPNATEHKATSLAIKSPLHSELNQGWNKTPAKWINRKTR
jgi:phage protein D